MNLHSITVAVVILLCSGCATVPVERLSESEKQIVRGSLAPEFVFPEGREEETFGLLYAAQRAISDGSVVAVRFRDTRHATIFIKAMPGSMHGSPSFNAVWDDGEWKFGNWWFPA